VFSDILIRQKKFHKRHEIGENVQLKMTLPYDKDKKKWKLQITTAGKSLHPLTSMEKNYIARLFSIFSGIFILLNNQ